MYEWPHIVAVYQVVAPNPTPGLKVGCMKGVVYLVVYKHPPSAPFQPGYLHKRQSYTPGYGGGEVLLLSLLGSRPLAKRTTAYYRQ